MAATAVALFVGLTPLLLTALPALPLLALCYGVEQRAARDGRHDPRPPHRASARSTHQGLYLVVINLWEHPRPMA
ncbi:hypothetical protein [Streptomyces sp. NPDC045714]|uniref:hypothetical protein n=1 Tax=Streptomyces sp. NPDC045714 TaxID=3154913 RepID=UPI0033CC5221